MTVDDYYNLPADQLRLPCPNCGHNPITMTAEGYYSCGECGRDYDRAQVIAAATGTEPRYDRA